MHLYTLWIQSTYRSTLRYALYNYLTNNYDSDTVRQQHITSEVPIHYSAVKGELGSGQLAVPASLIQVIKDPLRVIANVNFNDVYTNLAVTY